MKIIEDKFNCDKRMTCEWCNSIFEYDEDDVQGLPFGDSYVCCPCCGERNYLEVECKKKTVNNLQFPDDFYQYGQRPESAHLSDEEILEIIKDSIHSLKTENDSDWSLWEAGDTLVLITRDIESCEYLINVAKNYYQVEIPFEYIDYEITE